MSHQTPLPHPVAAESPFCECNAYNVITPSEHNQLTSQICRALSSYVADTSAYPRCRTAGQHSAEQLIAEGCQKQCLLHGLFLPHSRGQVCTTGDERATWTWHHRMIALHNDLLPRTPGIV